MSQYWLRQAEKPLFSELEWNKPERRDQAGHLLIVGGYQHNLHAPAKAYEYAKKEGVGAIQLILPNKVKSLVGATLPGAVFVPSTASGELARDGLEEVITQSHWADTLLLPGDLGRNSQTTLLIADLMTHTTLPAVLAKDAVDALKNTPGLLLEREKTTLVLSLAQLQAITKQLNWPEPITFSMGLVKLIELLKELSNQYPAGIITLYENTFVVAYGGHISTTSASDDSRSWRMKATALAACYQTWNPKKSFEALTHVAWRLSQ